MKPRRSRRQILTWTIILTIMATTLTVLWNVLIVQDYFRLQALSEKAIPVPDLDVSFRWTVFGIGVVFLIAIVIGLLMLGVKLYREVDYSQRQSNFIAGVTHEFKSPLAGIRLNTETLLTRTMSEEDRQRFLQGILSETERLGRLVDNILTAGKIDLQGFGISLQAEDLGVIISTYYESRSSTMAAQGVDWRLDIQDSTTVMLDPIALNIVLDNLVENAVKYSEGERQVTVEVGVEGSSAIIRVRDSGIGIHPEDRSHLKERFYRGKNQPRRKVPGTGLGLFLVDHMVKAHRGSMSLRSDGPGKGTVAEVRLPMGSLQPLGSPEVA